MTVQDLPPYLSTVLHILQASQGSPGDDWGKCAGRLADVTFYPHHDLIQKSTTIPSLPIRKLRLREVKHLFQGHTARKWQRPNLSVPDTKASFFHLSRYLSQVPESEFQCPSRKAQ